MNRRNLGLPVSKRKLAEQARQSSEAAHCASRNTNLDELARLEGDQVALDALRESEERYHALFDSVPVGLYRTTPEGQILNVNQAMVEMLGYPDRETLLKANASEMFVNPEDRRQEINLLDQEGLLSHAEFQLYRYDGEIIWVRDTVRSVRHNHNRVLYYDGSLEDITERKQAEQARSLLASIVEFSNEAIVGMDLDGTIVSWNSGAERIYHYSSAEVIGQPISILASPNLSAELPRLLSRVYKGGQVENYEMKHQRKDGQQILVSLTLSPIKDGSGQVIGVSKISRDISMQKRLEQYAIRAERLAAMGQIAASLAHEMKNPLQAIQSNLELVRDYSLEPDDREECLLVCAQEVEQLLDITQRMLSFARTDRQTLRPVSIQTVWQQALALLGNSLEKASIRINAHFPEDLPPVLAVADQIKQVLVNLVLNTLEVIPNGGQLNVDARPEGELLVLTLSNNGPPIPPEHLEHVFDPFFTTKPNGTGLGLFISHNILQHHGGTLSVENLKNSAGVAFILTLPVLSSPPAPAIDEEGVS